MNTCSFVGHSDLRSEKNLLKNNLRLELREEIKKMVEENNVTMFLNGGMGDFDDLCAETVHEVTYLKKEIKSYLVCPYLTKNLEINKEHFEHLFSKIFIPKELRNKEYSPSLIPKRNQIMMEVSDYVIAYVGKKNGGAFKTLSYTKKKSRAKIINLCENKDFILKGDNNEK